MIQNPVIRQIAYVVPDIRQACLQHAVLFGTGPFWVADNIPFISSTYRGKDVAFRHSAAFGQWGDVQVEFMQREDDEPSVLTEILDRTAGGQGIPHHKAIFVDDSQAVALDLEKKGFPIAFHGNLAGTEIFHVDTLDLYGHFIELFTPPVSMLDFFAMVREEASKFDGKDILREIAVG